MLAWVLVRALARVRRRELREASAPEPAPVLVLERVLAWVLVRALAQVRRRPLEVPWRAR